MSDSAISEASKAQLRSWGNPAVRAARVAGQKAAWAAPGEAARRKAVAVANGRKFGRPTDAERAAKAAAQDDSQIKS